MRSPACPCSAQLRRRTAVQAQPDEPALRTAAFVYDNALAVIALLACDKRALALRIGEALRTRGDRPIRVCATSIARAPSATSRWRTAGGTRRRIAGSRMRTSRAARPGNVAWTALALLAALRRDARSALARRRGESRALDRRTCGRGRCARIQRRHRWLRRAAREGSPGNRPSTTSTWPRYSTASRAQTRKAAGERVRTTRAASSLRNGMRRAGISSSAPCPMARRRTARIRVSTCNCGRSCCPTRRRSGEARSSTSNKNMRCRRLRFQHGPRRPLARRHRAGRTRLSDHRTRRGSRQTASRRSRSSSATGGFVYATREPRITTGLAIGSASTSADFYYYRLPHLGATAWAALAATKRNPFAAMSQARSARP